VSHSYSEPPDSAVNDKAELGDLGIDSPPLSAINPKSNVPRDKDMFVDSPPSSAMRKIMPVYPTQKKAVDL